MWRECILDTFIVTALCGRHPLSWAIGNSDYFLLAKTATASPTTSIWECNYLGDDGIGNDDMGMVQVTALGQLPPA